MNAEKLEIIDSLYDFIRKDTNVLKRSIVDIYNAWSLSTNFKVFFDENVIFVWKVIRDLQYESETGKLDI